MSEVLLFTKPWCFYCRRAKSLLESKGVRYDEIDVSSDPELEREMIRRARGRTTVPQIFVGDRHVGGSDELAALDRQGKLDEWLAGGDAAGQKNQEEEES